MARFIVRRLVSSLAALIVLLLVVFFASRVIGDPTLVMLPADAPESARDNLREVLGLNNPIHVQLWEFIQRALTQGFGESFRQNRPVSDIIIERLPNTGALALAAIALSLPIAVLLGSIAALKPRSVIDRFVNVISLAGISMVDFAVGLGLILTFGVWLGWLPTGGSGGWQFLVLPALTLSFRTTGRIAQFTRSAMMDEYAKPYIKTVRAKGMSERRVFLHALKNASVAVLTLAGDEVNSLVNGSIVVEAVFAWPGIGSLMVQAVTQRDLILIEASVFTLAVIVIALNFAIDLLYVLLDPRITFRSEVGA